GRLLEQRALQQARQVRVARQVRGQPVERRVHALGPEAVLPRDHVDDRPEPALEDGVVERLLAGEVVVEAGGGDPHLACQVAHRHAFHAARGEQALGGVEDDLAGRSGGSAVTGPPLDGSSGHGGGVTNERSLRQGAIMPYLTPTPERPRSMGMTETTKPSRSLAQVKREFSTDEACKAYLAKMRWPDGKVACPRCGETKRVYALRTRPFHWVCKNTSEACAGVYRFSVLTGAVFENTNVRPKTCF